MGDDDDPTDEALLALATRDGEAFGAFYDRHHLTVLAALRHRLGDIELALDLTAEIFAVALERCESFTPRGAGSARAWLQAIAHNKLVDLYRSGAAADRARRALQMQPLVVTDQQLEALGRRLAAEGSGALQALADLPSDERAAVTARVVNEAGYDHDRAGPGGVRVRRSKACFPRAAADARDAGGDPMTDDPLAQLRDQLVAAADRRNEARAGIPAPDRGRRTRRRGGWIALAAVLIAAPAGATAAGIIEFGESDESKARAIIVDVMRDTAELPPCMKVRTTRTVLSDAVPLPEITRTLPALRRAAAGVDPERVLRRLRRAVPGGAILRRTVRRFVMPGDVELIAYVQEGDGPSGARDPLGCHQARRERAEVLAGDRSEPVRQAVAGQLADLYESATRAQTLFVFSQSPPRTPFSGTGAGAPIHSRQPLRTGLLSSGGAAGGGRRYVGIAGPRTAAVLLRAQRPGAAGRFPTRVAVADGFYAFVLPRGLGPVSLSEVTASGRVLRVRSVRR